MDRGEYTPDELCHIITTCHESRVQALSLGPLSLKWNNGPLSLADLDPEEVEKLRKSQQREEDHALYQEAIRRREDDLEQLKLEDPEEYERLIAEGELDGA